MEKNADYDGLTDQDISELKTLFRAKTTQDGTTDLTKESFKSLVTQIVKEAGEPPSEKDLEAAFLLADEDRGGTVDLMEFTNLYKVIKRGEIHGLGKVKLNFLQMRRQRRQVKDALHASLEADKEREEQRSAELAAGEEALRLEAESQAARKAAIVRRRRVQSGEEDAEPFEAEHLLTSCFDGAIRVWNLKSGRVARRLERVARGNKTTKISEITCMDVYGEVVIAGTWNKAIIWNFHNGDHVADLAKCCDGWCSSIRLARRASIAVTVGDRTVSIWRIGGNGDEISLLGRCVGHRMKVNAIDVFGRRILTAGGDGQLKIWDLDTAQDTTPRVGDKANAALVAAKFSPDGSLALTGASDGTITCWNGASGERIRSFASKREKYDRSFPTALCFLPSDDALVGSSDGLLRCWDVTSGMVRYILAGHIDRVMSVSVPPGAGEIAFSGGQDGRVFVWNLVTGEMLNRDLQSRPNVRVGALPVHNGPVSAVIPVNFSFDLLENDHSPDQGETGNDKDQEDQRGKHMEEQRKLISQIQDEMRKVLVYHRPPPIPKENLDLDS
jgi:hypothetical protein